MQQIDTYNFSQWPTLLSEATPRLEPPIRWRQKIGVNGDQYALFLTNAVAKQAGFRPLKGREICSLSQRWHAEHPDSRAEALPVFLRLRAAALRATGKDEGAMTLLQNFANEIDPPHLAESAKATWITQVLDSREAVSFTGTECTNLVLFLQTTSKESWVIKLLKNPGDAISADHFFHTFGFETPSYVCVSAESTVGAALKQLVLDEHAQLPDDHHFKDRPTEYFTDDRTHLMVMSHLKGTPFIHLHPRAAEAVIQNPAIVKQMGRAMVLDGILCYTDRLNRLTPNRGNLMLSVAEDRLLIIDSGINHNPERLTQLRQFLSQILDPTYRQFFIKEILWAMGDLMLSEEARERDVRRALQPIVAPFTAALDAGIRAQARDMVRELSTTERQHLATHPLGQPAPESFDRDVFASLIDLLRETVQKWDREANTTSSEQSD